MTDPHDIASMSDPDFLAERGQVRAETPRPETNPGETSHDETCHGPATHRDLVEASLSNHRDHRDNAARWPAA